MKTDYLNQLANCFGLEVVGDAMAPNILEGDTLYVNPYLKPEGNAQDIAVLKINEGYHVCRFVRYGNQIMMLHDNAPTAVVKADAVEIIGKVIGGSFVPVNDENHLTANEMVSA